MSGVDELIQRGRGQGYLSLPELRAAFGRAGVSPAEARSILRELSDAGVRLGNDKPAAAGTKAATATSAAGPARRRRAGARGPDDPDPADLDADDLAGAGVDADDLAELDAASQAGRTARPADADDVPAPATRRTRRAAADDTADAEVDLDDQTSVMGDSVHTYLKSIGRTSLLTAEQEVNLAKRIEAGLFAEHKLETEAGLAPRLPARPGGGRRGRPPGQGPHAGGQPAAGRVGGQEVQRPRAVPARRGAGGQPRA